MKTRTIIRILSLTLALLLLILAIPACGEESDSGKSEDELMISSGGYFVYRDLYFYIAPTDKENYDRRIETFKYINFSSDETVGAPVYSDALGKDPFIYECKNGVYATVGEVVLDEKATEENDGIPVMIVTLPFEKEGEEHPVYRVASFNMATGQIKELYSDIGNGTTSFGLYGDTIYFTKFEGTFDMRTETFEGNDSFYCMPKTGGEPEKLFTTDGYSLELAFSWDGKLYLRSWDTYQIFCFDPAEKTMEPVCKYNSRWSEDFFVMGEYLYYDENLQTSVKEGYRDLTFGDLYRQPLKNLKDLTVENGELVLDDVWLIWFSGKTKFCYEKFGETEPYSTFQWSSSIVHEYDTETGESSILYDYSDQKGIDWDLDVVNEDYMILSATKLTPEGETEVVFPDSIVNRKTGERRPIEDLSW